VRFRSMSASRTYREAEPFTSDRLSGFTRPAFHVFCGRRFFIREIPNSTRVSGRLVGKLTFAATGVVGAAV
jgi:hypothetical protein